MEVRCSRVERNCGNSESARPAARDPVRVADEMSASSVAFSSFVHSFLVFFVIASVRSVFSSFEFLVITSLMTKNSNVGVHVAGEKERQKVIALSRIARADVAAKDMCGRMREGTGALEDG